MPVSVQPRKFVSPRTESQTAPTAIAEVRHAGAESACGDASLPLEANTMVPFDTRLSTAAASATVKLLAPSQSPWNSALVPRLAFTTLVSGWLVRIQSS